MEHSPSFDFLRDAWVLSLVTDVKLRAKVPKFITQEECDEILALPQDGVLRAVALSEQSD